MDEITLRIIVEIISAIACAILLWFMIKPYIVTREGRYIGLPLGFGFLGASYALSAIAYAQPHFYESDIKWIQLLFRAFAFLFLAVAYYFSKKPNKNTRYIWDIIFSGLFVCLAALILLNFIAPQIPLRTYLTLGSSIRILNIVFLTYILIHCYREYAKEPDPVAIWVLSGYALLGLSQLSYLIINFYSGVFAFWVSLALRLTSIVVFLIVSYRTFCKLKNGIKHE